MYVRDLFDPDRSKVEARDVIDLGIPGLAVSFRYGLELFTRCWNDAISRDLPLVAFSPYHRMLDMLDAATVLVQEACEVGMRPLLRTMFDCWMSVSYINEADQERRSAAFAVADLSRSLAFLESLDPSTERGKHALARMKKDRVASRMIEDNPHLRDRSADIRRVQSFLKLTPALQEAEEEWQTLKRKRRSTPRWHQLFGGPKTREDLAAHLGKPYLYEFLYRSWSGTSHGEDIHRLGAPLRKGTDFTMERVRDPSDLATSVRLALLCSSGSHQDMLRGYRPAESEENFPRWYNERMAPVFDSLNALMRPEVRKWLGIE